MKCFCFAFLSVLSLGLSGPGILADARVFWMAEGPLIADFDGNGRVDFVDFLLFLKSFNTQTGDADFNPRFDITGDGSVNFNDFLAFSTHYGYIQEPPVSPCSDRYILYVADTEDSSISALDFTSHLLLDYLPFRRPESVVVSHDQKHIFVSEDFGFFSLDTRHRVQFSVPVDSRGKMALCPQGARAFVTDMRRDLVRVVDLARGQTLDSISVGRRPIDIALSPDGTRLYVANQIDLNLTVIDVGSLRVMGQIVIGAIPGEVHFAPDGRRAYVTNLDRGVISVIDVESGRVAGAVQIDQNGSFGAGFAPDGRTLYIGAKGTLLALDTRSNLIVRTLKIGDDSTVLGIVPDGSRAYVGSFSYHSGGPGLTVVDLHDWKILGRLRGFFYPRHITFRKLHPEIEGPLSKKAR